MKIAVRTDASAEIGTGHLMRCLTLADALRDAGAEVTVLSAPAAAPWRGLVEGRGHRFVPLALQSAKPGAEAASPAHAGWLPWGQAADAAATLRALPETVDWLVVDHYALDHRWEDAVRDRARRMLAIDDIADRRHAVDVLLDHNPQDETGRRYDGLVPEAARRLIGPCYALLRPAFAAARERRQGRDGAVRCINIFMGGADAAGATLQALRALSDPALAGIAVDVVIGGASPHRSAIERAAGDRGNTALHVDAADMAELFAAADLAIGAGGVAALERCCVGLPTVAVAVAANQEPGLAALAALGAVRPLGRLEQVGVAALAAAVRELVASPQTRSAMARAAGALVDGGGVRRVAAAMLGGAGELAVRPATMADAALLHAWRDAPEVRAVSLSPEPIDYGRHCEWLSAALADPARLILIGLLDGEPVGSLRYDMADGVATVSIVVAPDCQGRGLGAALLAAGERHLRGHAPSVRRLRAIIKAGNAASLRLFARAGFTAASEAPAQMIYVKPLR